MSQTRKRRNSMQTESGVANSFIKRSCIPQFVPDESSQESTISNSSVGKYYRNLVVNDPIHGHIELHPLLVAIMDTPQFQRLRYIRQLGLTYFVFPGAMHSRFEHCIGVSHLTRQLLVSLAQRQPCLGITELDILCCEIAGLCHDLGHGCFSHFYEIFLSFTDQRGWRHEDMSTQMLEYLIEENKLMEQFTEHGLSEKDISFVKEMISNKPLGDSSEDWAYIGRGKDKSYLYDIVANKISGLDVDKWDYIKRDAYYLGIPNTFDSSRLMKFMRVVEVEGKPQICLRDKELDTVYEMYFTRAKLFRNAYLHKTVHAVEFMLMEALIIADPHLKFPTADKNKFVTLSEASKDLNAFSLVNDSILHMIRLSADPNLDEANNIIDRIMQRKLYSLIGKMYLVNKMVKSCDEIAEEICSFQSQLAASAVELVPADLKLNYSMIHFGMKQENPIDKLHFFSKSNVNEAFLIPKSELSYMLPANYGEYMFRVYCKSPSNDCVVRAKKCFRLWKESSSKI